MIVSDQDVRGWVAIVHINISELPARPTHKVLTQGYLTAIPEWLCAIGTKESQRRRAADKYSKG